MEIPRAGSVQSSCYLEDPDAGQSDPLFPLRQKSMLFPVEISSELGSLVYYSHCPCQPQRKRAAAHVLSFQQLTRADQGGGQNDRLRCASKVAESMRKPRFRSCHSENPNLVGEEEPSHRAGHGTHRAQSNRETWGPLIVQPPGPRWREASMGGTGSVPGKPGGPASLSGPERLVQSQLSLASPCGGSALFSGTSSSITASPQPAAPAQALL